MGQLDLASSNWSSGAGMIDSVNGLVTGIRHAHDGDQAAVAAEIGLAVTSTALDTVAMALDPLSKLTAAGLGWLIEHIKFLRTPLDMLAGDPPEIARTAEQLHEFAADIRNAASDMTRASRTATEQWSGPAADAFGNTMAVHQHRLDVVGETVDTVGYVVETSMALIAALRNLIRDMITTVLGDIVSTMLVALATAPFTFGASLVVGVSRCVVIAMTSVVQMMAKIGKVAGLSGRTARRIDDLVDNLGALAKDLGSKYADLRGTTRATAAGDEAGAERAPSLPDDGPQHSPPQEPLTHGSDFHDDGLGDEVYRDWLIADRALGGDERAGGGGHDVRAAQDTSRAEPSPADAPPAAEPPAPPPAEAPPAKNSPLRRFEVPALKKHEGWLRGQGFGNELDKVKFVDNWLKDNHPVLYPHLKALSDAKSAKNYVGLADKAALTFGKELTDIQQQAEQAWQQADERRRQEQTRPESGGGGNNRE